MYSLKPLTDSDFRILHFSWSNLEILPPAASPRAHENDDAGVNPYFSVFFLTLRKRTQIIRFTLDAGVRMGGGNRFPGRVGDPAVFLPGGGVVDLSGVTNFISPHHGRDYLKFMVDGADSPLLLDALTHSEGRPGEYAGTTRFSLSGGASVHAPVLHAIENVWRVARRIGRERRVLGRAGRDARPFDLDHLAEVSEGYTGAEIVEPVQSALYEAVAADAPLATDAPLAADAPLATEHVARTLRESPPLAVTMAEKIAKLRDWASDRCVPAD